MLWYTPVVALGKGILIMAEEKDLQNVEEAKEVVDTPEEAANPKNEESGVSEATAEAVTETGTEPDNLEDPEAVSRGETNTEDAKAEDENANRIPEFRAGDVLRVGVRITEGDKVRTQFFEGMVLSRRGAGVNQTFTIRKIGAGGIAVERIFPLYSPSLVSFEVRRRGVVRRSKIYFLRDIVGSTANVIKERKVVRDRTKSQQAKAEKKAARAQRKAESTKTAADNKKTGTRSSRRSSAKTS